MGAVSLAGHLCGCRGVPEHSAQQLDLRDMREIAHNASHDTSLTLAVIRPPPPAYYPHPPQYGTLFMEANAIERGLRGGDPRVAV